MARWSACAPAVESGVPVRHWRQLVIDRVSLNFTIGFPASPAATAPLAASAASSGLFCHSAKWIPPDHNSATTFIAWSSLVTELPLISLTANAPLGLMPRWPRGRVDLADCLIAFRHLTASVQPGHNPSLSLDRQRQGCVKNTCEKASASSMIIVSSPPMADAGTRFCPSPCPPNHPREDLASLTLVTTICHLAPTSMADS